ncbi:MAG: DUF2851 family protein [Dehalococcoidia bacterium]|nr:DUF2851 family protein [Dehalococcoidia bacterium]
MLKANAAGSPAPPEAALQAAWAALRGPNAVVTTAEGERLAILFPGLSNPGAGPDFHGAVIATERGRVVRGDVEVHRTEADWREHRHHQDSRYDAVILHVVSGPGGASVTELPGGRRVPVACLPAQAQQPEPAGGHPCTGCGHGLEPQALPLRLGELGRRRLRIKARRGQPKLERNPDQQLALACLDLPGTPHNRAAMRRVCLAVGPGWQAEAVALPVQQERLLAAAGLSHAKFAPRSVSAPPAEPKRAPDNLVHWDMSGCRPAAHPARRLLGAAVWYQRWAEGGGPAQWLLSQLAEPRTLIDAFTVTGEQAGVSGPAPVGSARAAAVAVNVAYPFLLAHAERGGDELWAGAIRQAWDTTRALEPDGVVR